MTTSINGVQDIINSIAIQQDQKIVVGGTTQVSPGQRIFALARYDTNGNLDTTFGSGGKVTTSINGVQDIINSIAIQQDQKIVVGGTTQVSPGQRIFALARYDINGSLDSTFGTGGKVTTSINGVQDRISSIAIQQDQQIVVGGNTLVSPGHIITTLARYKTDGSLDGTFGTGGIVNTSIQGIQDTINSIVLQQNQKIVVGGSTRDSSGNDIFSLARYNTNGSLDNIIGFVTTSINGISDIIRTIACQQDQKIVAGGFTTDASGNILFALTRYIESTPINNICFVEGTMISTDQGSIAIEKLTPYHTIHHQPIRKITKTIGLDKSLILFKKHSLGFNTPYRDTIVSSQHKILHNRSWYTASGLINHKTVISIPYHGEYLYNILMDHHTVIIANGLYAETLDPNHILSQIYSLSSIEEQNDKIHQLNHLIHQ